MADSFQLKAIITGVNRLSPTLTTMQKDLRKFKKEFKSIMQGMATAGAAITAAFVAPINQAIEFESAMADVKKVVNFDNPGQFKQMAEDVLDLSTQLPMAANGIAQIYAAGGQSGIARGELKEFATDAIKMVVAFDQTADESGQMMAQWRTGFKKSQGEVRELADQINYLGNTGPVNSKKIYDIVTRIGALGGVAGLSTGSISALGATVAVTAEPEIAATGIKNMMLALTKGARATPSQKAGFKFLKLDPKQLAKDMQKDAQKAILDVMSRLSKVDKTKQTPLLDAIFGSESITAIAPMLTNIELLRANLKKVNDQQLYSNSMQQEYASRAGTTANGLQLLKNGVTGASIAIGDAFTPEIKDAAKQMNPLLGQLRQFLKQNPELIKTTFKLGVYLAGVAVSITAVTNAIKFMGFVTKMSPLGRMMTLLIGAGALIVANWDTVGPVFKGIWDKIQPLVDQVGGWQSLLETLSQFVAVWFLQRFLTGMGGSGGAVTALTELLKTLFSYS